MFFGFPLKQAISAWTILPSTNMEPDIFSLYKRRAGYWTGRYLYRVQDPSFFKKVDFEKEALIRATRFLGGRVIPFIGSTKNLAPFAVVFNVWFF